MSSTTMMGPTPEKSTPPLARIAEVSYLLCLVTGTFALLVRIPCILGALTLWLLVMGVSEWRATTRRSRGPI